MRIVIVSPPLTLTLYTPPHRPQHPKSSYEGITSPSRNNISSASLFEVTGNLALRSAQPLGLDFWQR